jgi:hypothetical protein
VHVTGYYYDRLAIASIEATTAEIQGPWFKTLINIKISHYFTNIHKDIFHNVSQRYTFNTSIVHKL